MDIKIICKDCGKEFVFLKSEMEFYLSRELQEPKRCKACRNIKKQCADNMVYEKLGYKQSSFLENARIYGMPMPVEGGLYISHAYVIKVEGKLEMFYIIIDDARKKFFRTKDIGQATVFCWDEKLSKLQQLFKKKFIGFNVVLFPISSYNHIRG